MAPESDSIRRARPLLGTFVEIGVSGAARPDMEMAVEAAFAAVAQVHRLMSFHDPRSDVGRLNREASAHAVTVHAWTFEVLKAALELHRGSGGVFDIAVAPVLQGMGLLPRLEDDCPSNHVATSTAGAIELLDGGRVRFRHPGLRIDLGGIGKGFAVDRAVDALRNQGMTTGLVNAGGDLAAFGPASSSIHIRDPRDPRQLICRIEVSNKALASSGGRFDPFQSPATTGPAIIDPRTGERPRTVVGVTVRASSCTVADALSKVVMIEGDAAAGLLQHHGASALLVLADDVRITTDWKDAVHRAA